MQARALADLLTKRELVEVLSVFDECLACGRDRDFDLLIHRVALILRCEFALYGFTECAYDRSQPVHLGNVSNPPAWMAEYQRKNYVEDDPVRLELESRLARKESHGVFAWDAYERPLSAPEKQIIVRRNRHGLRFGFSAYCNSPLQDAILLVSFASARRPPERRAQCVAELIVPHLNRCRKRLDLRRRVACLTAREQLVAHWLIQGKTNWEIARILGVSEATAKYHVANILAKLKANSRQLAVSVLIAERCLS